MRRSIVVWLSSVLFFIVSAAASAMAAQSTKDVPVTSESKQALRVEILGEQAATGMRADAYVVGHGDLLGVSIYGEGDMAASVAAGIARPAEPGAPATPATVAADVRGVRVMMDGRMSLLHIGEVEVVGMTLTQVADYLKQLYASVYEDPIVTVTLVQSNSMRYTVMGKVASPGVFYLDYPVTIVQAIARSGGFTEWANKKITVVRERLVTDDEGLFSGNKLEFDFDRYVSGRDLQKNIHLRAEDILIVH